jgi:2-keto-4-pentenoate hydratase/2-oxohepta-3-ene-1,7-dioic acid hydratase in catechol pathway
MPASSPVPNPSFAVTPSAPASVPIHGATLRFPVHRVYCIGRNYADHIKEMGYAPPDPNVAVANRGTPVFFAKPADAVVCGDDAQRIPYPRGTSELHHEVELVVALGSGADGIVSREDAPGLIYGYAVGLDLTRRDLQAQAKAKGLPWDTAKGFDASAPISALVPASTTTVRDDALLQLEVNGELRQSAPLADMIFDVADVLHELSKLYDLRAGDLVFMGTPAGVGALQRGDRFVARIAGLVELRGGIAP